MSILAFSSDIRVIKIRTLPVMVQHFLLQQLYSSMYLNAWKMTQLKMHPRYAPYVLVYTYLEMKRNSYLEPDSLLVAYLGDHWHGPLSPKQQIKQNCGMTKTYITCYYIRMQRYRNSSIFNYVFLWINAATTSVRNKPIFTDIKNFFC